MRIRLQRRASRVAALLLLSLAVAACDGEAPFDPGTGKPGTGNPVPGPKPVAEVVVAPDTIALERAQTRMLSATLLAADRTELGGRAVEWSTSDSAVAIVNRDGIVWAVGSGTATITATSEGKQGRARVEVPPPPPPPSVASVRVTPGAVDMAVDPVPWQLTAKTFGPDGRELYGRAVTWTSSDTTRLKVYDGRLLPYGHGTVYVTATSEGKQAQVKVTIPEWEKARVLKGAAGLPLPALVATGTRVDGQGVTHTVRRVVTAGAIRLAFTGGRYEQRLTVQTYEDGVLVRTESYFDRGTYMYDMFTGMPVFTSTVHAGLTFRAEAMSDGQMAITQRIGREGAPATFVYGKQ